MRGFFTFWAVLFLGLLAITRAYSAECAAMDANAVRANPMWRRLSEALVTGVFDRGVRLRNGDYVGQPLVAGGQSRRSLRLWPELFAVGTLDSQPGEEVVGLLSETSGGSGERVYLLVSRRSSAGAAVWPAGLVGDRVRVRSLQIRDGRILLEGIEAGEHEPLCCGTQLNRQVWSLTKDGPRLVEKVHLGQLSLKSIEATFWCLIQIQSAAAPAPADSVTLIIRDGQITGQVGEGRPYSATIAESAPGQIAIFNVSDSATMGSGDLYSQESTYLSRLAAVTQYTFRAGRLLLLGNRAGQPVMLEFASTETRSP